MIRKVSVFMISAVLLATIVCAQQPSPSADDVAHRATDILGAAGVLEKARFISFTFNVELDGKVISSYPQKWDRYTGEYRVSGKTADGFSFEVMLNVNTKMGHGTLNGRAVTDSVKFKELFEIGYRRFINDTNWLLMPFEMFYPGVHRAYDGQRTDSCGRTWDLLKLTFDSGVGLPAGDIYWMWVNRDTGVIEEWDLKPRGAKPEDMPVEVLLRAYQRVGGLLLSTRREIRGKEQVIRFDDVKILPDVPKGAFD